MLKPLILAVVMLGAFAVNAQKKCKLTVSIEYKGLVEGYIHNTKDQIFINDVLVTETPSRNQELPYNGKLTVQAGDVTFKVVNWTLYEGNWEETLIENQYSIDATKEMKLKLGKKNTLKIVYDLDDPSDEPTITFE